ncbi:uncharacterized protein BT62DRAFT_921093 [Guyanagaster necrorhizus]|uniref:Uncharacterized protein n=1 Tax=Guyanagaster necrorhizus TaxID=856835 RepID=A0A9P7VQB8_9AGAR|nr:uncharacterized protein BT62DRAFT_921093 [Guyanagaster necrorhizus MCA 3950]KAG7444842.1 hypothetical protein BT62DRAFT_921093 [Guyanagaster necrorhizus MCA 3950]
MYPCNLFWIRRPPTEGVKKQTIYIRTSKKGNQANGFVRIGLTSIHSWDETGLDRGQDIQVTLLHELTLRGLPQHRLLHTTRHRRQTLLIEKTSESTGSYCGVIPMDVAVEPRRSRSRPDTARNLTEAFIGNGRQLRTIRRGHSRIRPSKGRRLVACGWVLVG